MTPRQAAIARMNELGRRREPFLFLIDFEEQTPLVLPLAQVDPTWLRYDFGGVTNAPPVASAKPEAVILQKSPAPFSIFNTAFERVQAELHAGNTFLLNLTARTPITLSLTLEEVFRFSQARYRILSQNEISRTIANGQRPTANWVCFSPEPFVRVANNRISTFPMKGTLPADAPDARARLLADPKEEAEHYTIVDLLRNDLSLVAKRVRVDRFRYVEEIATHRGPLLQASSEISGELPPGWPDTLGDWFFRLLPAGSVSGAPKKRTVEIIRSVEDGPRGFYTGVAGIFDGKTLDSTVLIRFIEQTADGLYFRSGGGITFQSDARAEYDELLAKIYVPIS
jgi:para-aminobenzoate synthetase component 1